MDTATQDKAIELVQAIDAIGGRPSSRTEPDVVLDFGAAGVVFIEVKYRGRNDRKPADYAGWPTYLQGSAAFANPNMVLGSCLYELARNWRAAWDFARDRRMVLINLGQPMLFQEPEAQALEMFTDGLALDACHHFTGMTWADLLAAIAEMPPWLAQFLVDRGLA